MGQVAQCKCGCDAGQDEHEADGHLKPDYPEPISALYIASLESIGPCSECAVAGEDEEVAWADAQPHKTMADHNSLLLDTKALRQNAPPIGTGKSWQKDTRREILPSPTGSDTSCLTPSTGYLMDSLRSTRLNSLMIDVGLPSQAFVSGVTSSAYQYRADPNDDVDLEVERILSTLEQTISHALSIRRVDAGIYEIEGRTVRIYWGNRGTEKLLLVHEDDVEGSSLNDYSLPMYLDVAGNVLMSTTKSMISRTMAFDTSFVDSSPCNISISDLHHGSFSQGRADAMRVACSQAEMRQVLSYPSPKW